MKSRILYTKPYITEPEISYATDAAANGWGDYCFNILIILKTYLENS